MLHPPGRRSRVAATARAFSSHEGVASGCLGAFGAPANTHRRRVALDIRAGCRELGPAPLSVGRSVVIAFVGAPTAEWTSAWPRWHSPATPAMRGSSHLDGSHDA